jgi:hypothetical protein
VSRQAVDHLIADQMAVAVVYRLEVIDVDHHAGHLRALVDGLQEDLLSALQECAPRQCIGELIVVGEVLQLARALLDLRLGELELCHGIEQLRVHIFDQRQIVHRDQAATHAVLVVDHRCAIHGDL